MDIDILNENAACSTLIISGMGNWPDGDNKGFSESLKESVEEHQKDGGIWSDRWDEYYPIESFSFITASTNHQLQIGAEMALEGLGFYGGKATQNDKNFTTVRFWVLDIPTFLENLKKVK